MDNILESSDPNQEKIQNVALLFGFNFYATLTFLNYLMSDILEVGQ